MLCAFTSFLQGVLALLLVGGNLLKSVNELDLLAVESAADPAFEQPEWSYATSTILRARDDDEKNILLYSIVLPQHIIKIKCRERRACPWRIGRT